MTCERQDEQNVSLISFYLANSFWLVQFNFHRAIRKTFMFHILNCWLFLLFLLGHEKVEIYSPASMAKYYNKIVAERKKQNPNKKLLNCYLNLEFLSRQNCINCTKPKYRYVEFFKTYTLCFIEPFEVRFLIKKLAVEDLSQNLV